MIRLKQACAIVALMLMAASPAAAQQQARVSGTVTDALGARVANVSVILTDGRGTTRETTSGSDGTYTFDGVSPGEYQVTATLQGFAPFASPAVYVAAGANQVVEITMQVGALQQDVVVTAAATQLSQAQTGAPITVLDSRTLDALQEPDTLEALRLVPGAQVQQTGGRGGITGFFIRGGNANFNKVLIDGAVVNDIGGAFDFAQLSMTGIDRVEVMRQTNSVMYGSDALAGVVNITTKRGATRVPEVTYAADGGNLGTWSSDAGVGGMYKRFDYYSSYGHYATDNSVPNNAYRNDTYAGRFGVAVGSGTNLSGTLRSTRTTAGTPNAFSLFGIADDSSQRNELLYGSVTADSQLTDRWQTTVRFGSTGQTTHYVNPAPTGDAFDPFGFGANYLGNPVTITGANGYTASGRAILDFGGDYPQPFDSRATRRTLSGETTYVVNESLSFSGGARYEREQGYDVPDGDPSETRNNGGAFVEGRAALADRHYITAGVGVEHNAVFGEAATPRLSIASYLRRPSTGGVGDTKIVLNAGSGIKAPSTFQSSQSLFELVNGTPAGAGVEPIGPERSRSFDVGIEQGFASGRARARVSYFHNTFRDLIEFLDKTQLPLAGVPVEIANATAFGAYVNSQSYRAQGVEMSVEAAPRADLHLAASYTRLNAIVTKAFSATESFNPAFPDVAIGAFSPLVGQRPFDRPASSGTAMVMYTPRKFQVTLSAYFAGKRDGSTFLSDEFFGNSLLLPNHDLEAAYQKVDLSASYQIHPQARAYVAIDNLFDQKYEASFGFPSLPIAARFGVSLTFGGDHTSARP
jgi:iron complex outermembrane receptor protein/vitamin B12 transporter